MGIAVRRRTLALGIGLAVVGTGAVFSACSDSYTGPHGTGGGTSSSSSASAGGAGGMDITLDGGGGSCDTTCSNDLKNVIDCKGQVITACTADQGCANGACIGDPCMAAEVSKSSYGCDYWALKTVQRPQVDGACFAAFVANTWGKAVHLQVERDGQALPVETFAVVAKGTAPYPPYDPTSGLGVGEVAILFLSRQSLGGAAVADCPVAAAVDGETGISFTTTGNATGIGKAFHVTSDYPVVAYQMVPYGGAQAYVTSATLLLPTSAWDTNYIAINAYATAEPAIPLGQPSLDVVAYKDNTQVTILPKSDITGGPAIPGSSAPVAAAAANTQVTYTLNKGEFLQITQPAELTGSVIQSTESVGVFGASACMQVPQGQPDCDSAQQQLAPVRALGSEYVGVRYRGRGADLDGGTGGQEEVVPWRLVGAVDGTTLAWEPSEPPGAPKSIGLGEVVELSAAGPFVVKSQDGDHPFYLGTYMTGGGKTAPSPSGFAGEGDPDWVNVITPAQYLTDYVFFTDTTYPETNLVLVRTPSKVDGTLADVTLTCSGGSAPMAVTGWQPIGAYEYTRVDLSTGNFTSVNGCTNGRQELTSPLPFGVTVWGWGHKAEQTQLVSYAYPAGAGFQPINHVMIPPIPK